MVHYKNSNDFVKNIDLYKRQNCVNQSNMRFRVIFNTYIFRAYLIESFLLCKYLFALNIY